MKRLTGKPSLLEAAVERSGQKRALMNIGRINAANRAIISWGNVSSEAVMPPDIHINNVIISGGSDHVRNDLILSACIQDMNCSIPTVILHEGNIALESALFRVFSSTGRLGIINSVNRLYEPVCTLSPAEIAYLISRAASDTHSIGSGGVAYIKMLAEILLRNGIRPSIDMFAHCCHERMNELVFNMELEGKISHQDGVAYRNIITAADSSLPDIDLFFGQLGIQSAVIQDKQSPEGCMNIIQSTAQGGIIAINVTAFSNRYLISLITGEIELCMQRGVPVRIIADAVSFAGNKYFVETIRNGSYNSSWLISTPDICRLSGSKDENAVWLALSDRAVFFAHGIQACEFISSAFGEYDRIDVSQSYARNTGFAGLGYNYGTNIGYSTSMKRDRIIKPEEIQMLSENEFFMLDNNLGAVSRGRLEVCL